MRCRTIVALGMVMAALGAAAEGKQEFLESGKLAFGVNYWASRTATRMWQDWQPDEIAKDLDVIKAQGFGFLRVFPRWDVFQPIWEVHSPNRKKSEVYLTADELPRPETPAGYAGVDEKMMERFEAFCDLCAQRDLKLVVCVMTGQMTFRIFVPQALQGLDLYADPMALKWERRFIDYFVRRMKHHRAIAAWESGNETCCLGPIASPDAVEAWLALIHGTFRLADPSRPVIGPNGTDITGGPWRVDCISALSDVLAVHPYNMWSKAYLHDGNGIRNALLAASQNMVVEQIGGRPCFVEEHGVRRAESLSRDNVARYVRGLCWNLWAMDCRGLGWWCAFDQDNQLIPPYDWREPYLELGIFKSDRSPYPAAAAVRRFQDMLGKLPFARLPKAKSDCVIVVPDCDLALGTLILARQAGLMPTFADPTRALPEASVYFLPDAKGRAWLTQTRWEDLKARVREGGATLAVSWNNTFLSHHEEVFGAEIESRAPGKLVFRPLTAEVIERDADGNPRLMANRYGKGRVYLLTRPISRQALDRAGGFDSDLWKYYARVCPKRLLLETGSRDVMVSEHRFDDGTVGVVAVNNSPKPYAGTPRIDPGWKVGAACADDDACARWTDGRLELSGNSGIFLRLEPKK